MLKEKFVYMSVALSYKVHIVYGFNLSQILITV